MGISNYCLKRTFIVVKDNYRMINLECVVEYKRFDVHRFLADFRGFK